MAIAKNYLHTCTSAHLHIRIAEVAQLVERQPSKL